MQKKRYPQKEIAFKDIFEKALKFLSMRDHSIFELRNKLKQRYEDEEVIEEVLEKCLESKYLDDKRFATVFIRNQRKKSTFLIAQGLRRKGVAQGIIDEILEDAEIDDHQTAVNLAKKKKQTVQHLPLKKQKSKITLFLKNKGFGFNVITKTMHELYQ